MPLVLVSFCWMSIAGTLISVHPFACGTLADIVTRRCQCGHFVHDAFFYWASMLKSGALVTM